MKWLSLFIAVTLSSCSLVRTLPPKEPHLPITSAANDSVTMLVFSHGLHTGLTLPYGLFKEHLPELDSESTTLIEFGWGDEGFYRSETISLSLAFQAMFIPTPGVMHVVHIREPAHLFYAHSQLVAIPLTKQEAEEIALFIAQSFARDHTDKIIDLGPGRYGDSQFYRARERYFFPRTCNDWTSRALNKVGCDGNAITAPAVLRNVRRYLNSDNAQSYKAPRH